MERLKELLSRPGRSWSETERIACIEWLLERKQTRSLLALISRNVPRSGFFKDANDILLAFLGGKSGAIIQLYDPEKGNFWAYLKKCLLRYCKREAAQLYKLRSQETPVSEVQLETIHHSPETDLLSSLEIRDLLQKGLNILDADLAQLIIEVHLKQRSPSELAREMGISPNALRIRLFRARYMLKQIIIALQGK